MVCTMFPALAEFLLSFVETIPTNYHLLIHSGSRIRQQTAVQLIATCGAALPHRAVIRQLLFCDPSHERAQVSVSL